MAVEIEILHLCDEYGTYVRSTVVPKQAASVDVLVQKANDLTILFVRTAKPGWWKPAYTHDLQISMTDSELYQHTLEEHEHEPPANALQMGNVRMIFDPAQPDLINITIDGEGGLFRTEEFLEKVSKFVSKRL